MAARHWAVAALLLLAGGIACAGTTGKIAGRVTDAQTREGLPGASIIIEGTFLGGAADPDGYYYINNIPPGSYKLHVSQVGYQKTVIQGVIVKIDLTTKQDIRLTSTAVQAEEVVVTAERPLVQKDLTSSSVTVSSDELKVMPVEDIAQVINIQAGVVGGHFRGGRSDEVGYLIDGVAVTDPFNGAMNIQVEKNSIREMEVISGTFNAEYGQAMSGIVNIVTQDGASSFHGSLAGAAGGYFTSHTDLFPNLDRFSDSRIKDYQFTLSGPAEVVNNLSFFLTGRYFYDDGYLYGKRVYNTTDMAPTFPVPGDNTVYINHNTGDGKYITMDPYRRYSFNGKLTYALQEFKISYSSLYDDNWNKYYDQSFAWTPDGLMNHYRLDVINSLQITHVPSQSTFETFKFSLARYDFEGFLYPNPYDPRYVDPNQGVPLSGYTFRSGGNQTDRYERESRTFSAQWALSSQLSKEHKLGIGIEGKFHHIYNHNLSMVNSLENVQGDTSAFAIGYRQLGAIGNQQYIKNPVEIAAYVQDKIEYDIMIINAGLRFDYLNPRSSLPADLRNPMDNPDFPGAGQMVRASKKMQISPRLGISFPITDQGIIHFSYGHFFQIPTFTNLYDNSDYLIDKGSSLTSQTGNPDLKPQRTISYEIGLQQVLFTTLSLDFSVYYRDIRNLLGMEIIQTYDGFEYARFINRDYGNVRGFILSLERRLTGYFGIRADYTYQIAEGNASDPRSVFYNNQSNPPVASNTSVVPLNWDQRSTLNMTLTVGVPSDWTVGLIFAFGSGFPYTEDVRVSQGARFENGGLKPTTNNVDLRADKYFSIAWFHVNAYLLVYNLLDIKNEQNVNASTGRANEDIYSYLYGTPIGLNTIQQYLNDPTSFSAPREIRLGVMLDF